MEALILAGDSPKPGLWEELGIEVENKALLDIVGRPMLCYVLDSILQTKQVNRVLIVGPREKLAPFVGSQPRVELIPQGEDLISNLKLGVEHLSQDEPALISTADIPLITPEVVSGFLDSCKEFTADFYYPIVKKETNEACCPGGQRTYVCLKDGVFTGGNMVLLNIAHLTKCIKFATWVIENRKNPLQMARVFGPWIIIKLLLKQATIKELEKRAEQITGIKARAVVCEYPEIGIDVDKPVDLKLVSEVIAKRADG